MVVREDQQKVRGMEKATLLRDRYKHLQDREAALKKETRINRGGRRTNND